MASSSSITVLHVDDEPDFGEVVAEFIELQNDCISVETASAADEGLGRVEAEDLDCIVSDFDMPGQNGIEFLEAVRETHPDLPFILYTGKGSEEVASDAISTGATDYLQKESGTGQYELLANRIKNAVSQAQSQRAERHLRELAENTDRILYIFNHNWSEILFINPAYEELWGRSIESLRENPADFLNGIHPKDRDKVRKAMEEMSGGNTIETEYRVNPEENYERWVRVRGEPITDESDDVVRVAGFATDITDRKELQQQLQARTDRLQKAQQVASVGSWEWEMDSDTVLWSDETYRIFGQDPGNPDEPTFEDWFEAIHPTDREEVQETVEGAVEAGSFPTFEHRLQRPGGEVRWVKCRGNIIRKDDEPVRIAGTVLDVTESKEYEQELKYQRSVLESVIETLPQGVLVVDDDREFFKYNRRFVEMWDIPEGVVKRGDDQEALESVLDSLKQPDEFLEKVEYFYDHANETGHDRIHLVDGRVFERYTAPATGKDGTYYGRSWVFQDITVS